MLCAQRIHGEPSHVGIDTGASLERTWTRAPLPCVLLFLRGNLKLIFISSSAYSYRLLQETCSRAGQPISRLNHDFCLPSTHPVSSSTHSGLFTECLMREYLDPTSRKLVVPNTSVAPLSRLLLASAHASRTLTRCTSTCGRVLEDGLRCREIHAEVRSRVRRHRRVLIQHVQLSQVLLIPVDLQSFVLTDRNLVCSSEALGIRDGRLQSQAFSLLAHVPCWTFRGRHARP